MGYPCEELDGTLVCIRIVCQVIRVSRLTAGDDFLLPLLPRPSVLLCYKILAAIHSRKEFSTYPARREISGGRCASCGSRFGGVGLRVGGVEVDASEMDAEPAVDGRVSVNGESSALGDC